jgi:outer membrane protein
MKNLKLLPIINLVILIVGMIFLVIFLNPKETPQQYGYVDNLTLFSEFNMVQDLQKTKLPVLNVQQKKVDSLYQLLQKQTKVDAIQELKQKMYVENNKLQNLGAEIKQQINSKVWERLNMYLEEFGKEKKVHLIFGIQGNGNIMYADDAYNFTQEAVQFANSKYEGNQ